MVSVSVKVLAEFGIGYSIGRKYRPIWVSVSVSDENQNRGFGRTLMWIELSCRAINHVRYSRVPNRQRFLKKDRWEFFLKSNKSRGLNKCIGRKISGKLIKVEVDGSLTKIK